MTSEEIAKAASNKFWSERIGMKEKCWGNDIYEMVLAAIEQALAQVPVPGPVSEERLAVIRKVDASLGELPPLSDNDTENELYYAERVLKHHRRDCLQHIAHLARVLQDCAADGLTGAWQAGYQAGHVAGWREGAEQQRGNDEFGVMLGGKVGSIVPHPSEENQSG